MNVAIDKNYAITPEGTFAEPDLSGGPAQLTPQSARRLAVILAPHLLAMRAVLAGTRHAGAGSAPSVSPATKIFIAGMLERIAR